MGCESAKTLPLMTLMTLIRLIKYRAMF
jgi:hypothetical protein